MARNRVTPGGWSLETRNWAFVGPWGWINETLNWPGAGLESLTATTWAGQLQVPHSGSVQLIGRSATLTPGSLFAASSTQFPSGQTLTATVGTLRVQFNQQAILIGTVLTGQVSLLLSGQPQTITITAVAHLARAGNVTIQRTAQVFVAGTASLAGVESVRITDPLTHLTGASTSLMEGILQVTLSLSHLLQQNVSEARFGALESIVEQWAECPSTIIISSVQNVTVIAGDALAMGVNSSLHTGSLGLGWGCSPISLTGRVGSLIALPQKITSLTLQASVTGLGRVTVSIINRRSYPIRDHQRGHWQVRP